MSYSVIATPKFSRDIKKLAKKYPSIKTEFAELVESLGESPEQGTNLGNSCFKMRMAIASKGKGKSGGARVITYFQVTIDSVYLLTIYDKSDRDTVSNSEIKELLEQIPEDSTSTTS